MICVSHINSRLSTEIKMMTANILSDEKDLRTLVM